MNVAIDAHAQTSISDVEDFVNFIAPRISLI